MGALTGAWNKPEAVYIGHTARARARERRLLEISLRLQELDGEDSVLAQEFELLAAERTQADGELSNAPLDDSLHAAVRKAMSAGDAVLQARSRLGLADAQYRAAEDELQTERRMLERDAADLQLPIAPEGLLTIASAVDRFMEAHVQLFHAARAWGSAWPDSFQQQEREAEAGIAVAQREQELTTANDRAETARSRFAVLHASIGAKVETLRQQLAQADAAVKQADVDVEDRQQRVTKTSEARGIADARATSAEQQLGESTTARTQAIERLQRFAESGLLSSALPELPVPESGMSWTIDPAFLSNHREAIAAMDFFEVPTLTFGMLYCFFVIAHDRRRVLHYNVTKHPNSAWICHQLREAFPYDSVPRYLIFDHGQNFNEGVVNTVKSFGVLPKRTSPHSPWQNGVAERWVGNSRRNLLDHVIVFNERHLKRLMSEYVRYYNDDRTHLALEKGTPAGRGSRDKSRRRLQGNFHAKTWRFASSLRPRRVSVRCDQGSMKLRINDG